MLTSTDDEEAGSSEEAGDPTMFQSAKLYLKAAGIAPESLVPPSGRSESSSSEHYAFSCVGL